MRINPAEHARHRDSIEKTSGLRNEGVSLRTRLNVAEMVGEMAVHFLIIRGFNRDSQRFKAAQFICVKVSEAL